MTMTGAKGDPPHVRLPLWAPQGRLVHIGTMRQQDKGDLSWEGHGLSVSECPESWEHIAKLGGKPWWHLQRTDAVFLDWHAVTADLRAEFLNWGVCKGLCATCEAYRLTYNDAETQERTAILFERQQDAIIEAEDFADESPEIICVQAWRLTEAGRQRSHRRRTFLDESPVLVAILWTEMQTKLDGVYWDDVDLPLQGSAPAAVILPSRLSSWHVTPYSCLEAPRSRRMLDRQA